MSEKKKVTKEVVMTSSLNEINEILLFLFDNMYDVTKIIKYDVSNWKMTIKVKPEILYAKDE